MTKQHPITVPPELMQQWVAEIWHEGTPVQVALSDEHIATRAAQWGADQELEACCDYIHTFHGKHRADWLHDMRRLKPLSLKERLSKAITDGDEREALKLLEQLDD